MLEFALAISASVPFARNPLVRVGDVGQPVRIRDAVVTAVSVWPTCAVPVMVGAPIAALLAAAETTISKVSLTESVPSLAVTFTETVSTSAAARRARERARGRGEAQPTRGSAESSDWVAM